MTKEQFLEALENGPYAWPGGYPIYFLMSDGEAMSFQSAKDNKDLILAECDNLDRSSWDQWKVIGFEINWEDTDLRCSHSDELIPSAYGEEEN